MFRSAPLRFDVCWRILRCFVAVRYGLFCFVVFCWNFSHSDVVCRLVMCFVVRSLFCLGFVVFCYMIVYCLYCSVLLFAARGVVMRYCFLVCYVALYCVVSFGVRHCCLSL